MADTTGGFTGLSTIGFNPSYANAKFDYADGGRLSMTDSPGSTGETFAGATEANKDKSWDSGLGGAAGGATFGLGIGAIVNGFTEGAVAKKSYNLSGNMAWLNATGQAATLKQNAQRVSEAAGNQEYALYKEQKRRLASMEAKTAANGVALEGSAAHVLVKQAGTDAKNRDALIESSKNQQFTLLLKAQQTLQAGRNAVAYSRAMGKAAEKAAIINGFMTGMKYFISMAGMASAANGAGTGDAQGGADAGASGGDGGGGSSGGGGGS